MRTSALEVALAFAGAAPFVSSAPIMLSPLLEVDSEGLEDEAAQAGPPSPLPLTAKPGGRWARSQAYLPTLLDRARSTCTQLCGLAHTRLVPLSFSHALLQGLAKRQGANRLSLVQAHVTHMDVPPAGVLPQPLHVLHLSRNALRTLHGTGQSVLGELTALSLAHNCIDDVTVFAFLGAMCPGLTDLRVEGNPVCSLLDAQAHAAAALPFLRTFDGREVTPQERRAAVVKVRGEEAAFNSMLVTASMLLALEAANARRRVHAAIRRIAGDDEPDVEQQEHRQGATRRLLSLWDMPRRITDADRRALLRALRCESLRLAGQGEAVPAVALEQTLLTALEDGLEAADDADAATIGERDETADDELWFSLPADLSIGGITPAAIPAQSQSRRPPLPPPPRARSIGNVAALGKRSIAELLASPPPRLPSLLRTVSTAAAWGNAVQPSPNHSPGAEAAQFSPGQAGDNKRIISPPAPRGSGGSAVAASSPAPSQSAGPNRWSSPPRPRVGSPKPSNGAYALPASVGSPPSASASKERTLWLEIQSLRAAAAASAALELRLTRDNEALRAHCAAASEDAAASVAAAEDALRSMQEHMRASLDAQHQAVEDSARARTAAAAAQAAHQASAEATATAEARARDAEAQVRALSQQVVEVTEQRDQALVAAESATEANRAVSLDMAAANGRLDAAVRETARLTALVDKLNSIVQNREEALSGMAHTVNILHNRTDRLAVFAMKRAQAARLRMAFRGWRAATAHAWAIAAGAELSARSRHRETEMQMFFLWRDTTRNARHSDMAARRAGALNARIQLNGLRRCLHAWSRIARAGSTVAACEHVSMAVMQEQVETLTQRLETSEQEQRVRDEMHRQGIAKMEELAVEKQRLLDIALQEARARASAAEQRSAAYRKEAQSAARAAAESAASSADAAVADAISACRSAASEVSRLNAALDEAQRAASLAQAAATRAQRERDSALAALSDAERRLNLRERRKFETAVAQRPASPGLHAASRSRPSSPTRSARGSGEDGQRLPSLGPPQPPPYGAMQPVPPPFRSAVAPQPLFGSQASSSPAMQRAQLTTLRVARVRV